MYFLNLNKPFRNFSSGDYNNYYNKQVNQLLPTS